ncbi:unnamed protein product [Hapterophycus canaliculatus]
MVAPAATQPMAPVVRQRTPVRRRKSSSGLIFGTLTLLLLASIVGGMAYFFLFGPGEVQIVKTDNGFQIKTGGQSPEGPVVAPPRQVAADSSPQNDGVLKAPEPSMSSSMNSLEADLGQAALPESLTTNEGPAMSQAPAMTAETATDFGPKPTQPTGPMPEPAKPR